MAVAFPYEAGARAPGVTADAPEVTDEMAIAASGEVPDGMTADEAFGAITEGRSYTQELGEGFQRGQAQTSSMLAMGMETVASALGFDHTAQKFRERSEILDQEAASHPTSVASYTDVKDFESGAKYALGILGEQAPQLAMDAGMAIGSGGLAAAGSIAFRKGVTAAVVKQAFKTNAWRGMAASQYGQNLGESRKMQLAEGVDDPTTAFTAAAGKTVLDYASSRVMLKSALGLASRGMKNEAMQLLKEGFKSSPIEGITEGMQAAVDHAVIAGSKAGYRMDTQEVADDIINSTIAGLLVGATPATIQATIQGAQKTGKLTLDMLQKREGKADGQSQTDTTEQDASLSGLPEEAPLPGSAAASVQNYVPVDAEKEDVNAEPTGLPTAEPAPKLEAAPADEPAGQTDLQTDRQPAALWATRSGRVSDDAGVGVADNGTGVPTTAATADEQPSLITEEQRSRAAAIATDEKPAGYDLLARNQIPDERLYRIGDNGESPWLLQDGAVVGSNGDHISLADELGYDGYRDMSIGTGAVRSSFHIPKRNDGHDRPFVSLQLFDDQQLTQQQYDRVVDFVKKTNASVLLGVDRSGSNTNNVPMDEVSLEELRNFSRYAGGQREGRPAATADEQPSLITEEQRGRAAAIATPTQHASVDANGLITEEADPAPDTVFEKGAVKRHGTGILRSALASITKANDERRAEEAAERFTAEENAPKERADNRELGAAKVAPVDFLLSQNMATSENDTAELYSEESKKATSSEVEDVLNSFVNAHGDKVGSFQITDTPNRDAETDAIFNAVRRGIEKAQRSETRTEILKTSIADPTAAERLEVPQEKLPALKDAARRDQNSTWATDKSFVYFQDERNANNVFPVYMPDAVIGVLSSPHTMANRTEGDSRTKVATAIGDIISAMADEGYHPITVNSKGETVPFADAYAAAPVAYVGKTALGQSGSRTVTLADLSNPVDKANLIDGPKKELFDGSELAQMNRDILREDKLLLLQRALKHFSASGDTAPAMVVEAIKRRIAALEYTESLRGPVYGGYAASAEAGRRAATLRGTLVELQKTMRELATKSAADLAKAEADARAAEASLTRLAEDINAGVPEKELLESARDAVRKAAYSKEIADKSAVECSLQNILDLLDSELLELRQDSAARAEEGTHELLAEGKPDAEQESDPLGATKNPANDDLTSALFALRRSEAADERLAQSDAREKLTTYQGKKRVPPREADVQAYVEQVRANMQRGTEQVGQEARRVISSDPMLQAGGLLDRVDAVAAEAGITGKVAIVQANLNGRVATVSLQADGALVKVDSAWFAAASPEAREAVLMHELGHVATAQIISAADPKVLQRLRADFDAYRAGLSDGHAYNKNPVTGFDEYLADQFAAYIRGRGVRATSSSGKRGGVEAVFASIKQKLSSLVKAISKFLFGADRLSGTAVGFQFMDSMFAAARNSKRGAAGSKDFFESWMRQVYDNPERRVRDRRATAEAAGLSTTSGELDARDFDLNKAREAAGGITNAVLGAVKHPLETGRKLAVAADRLHREVPIFITAREELKWISKELMRKYDQVFDGSRADIDAWQQRVHRIFSAIHADPKKEQALADYIAGRAPLPRELRAYLEALYDHVNADLPTLNKVLEFFPRMYDIEAVNNRQDEFLQMLHAAGMSPDAAKNAWHNIVNGKNLYTAEIAPEVSIHGSTFQNAKQRMLTNVSDEVLRQNGFLQNDVHAVLLHYTQKAIRMKHYAREFAQYTHLRHSADSLRDFLPDVMFDDRDTVAARNRKMLSWMLREKVPLFDLRDGHPLNEKEKLQQIKEPSDDNDFMAMNMPFIKQAIKQKWIVPENHRGQVTFAFYDMNAGLRDVVRTLPVEQQRRAAMIIDAYEGRLAADKLSPKARNLMSNIVAYQNLRTMLFSAFTSLADASGLVFKGGDFRGAWENLKAMGEIVGELRRGDKLQLYRDLGYAERQSAMQAFLEAYGIQHQSKASARVNNFLFTWNGQIALTNGIRLMGAALAERHIQRAVKDIKNGTERQKDNAQAMLRDLGLSLDDAAALTDDFKRYNHYVDTGTTNTAEGQRAFRLHEAVNKYVDSAITRPDARARPVWGSDPRFMLLYQFKSFVFAYWEKIMKPILAESYRRYGAIEGSRLSKAAAAAAPLAVFVLPTFALSALGLWLRQILQYEVWGDEAPAKQMELPEYTYEVIKRGGILGPFELGFTFVENNAEGRSGVTQLMGPTASHLELLLKGDTGKSLGASVPVFSQIPALRDMVKEMFE